MLRPRIQFAYLASLLTLILGLAILFDPLLAVRLLGLEVVDPRGLSEVRATYGGLFTMMGALMLWAAIRPRSNLWLRFAGLLWGAVALGRTFSVVIDGVITPLNLGVLLLEMLIGASALLGSFSSRREAPRVTGEDDTPDPLRAYRG